jgi:hypothetical protein
MIGYLKKMSMEATLSEDGTELNVLVPPTRSDILHACDIMEDIAISYGFNKVPRTLPQCYTVGKYNRLNSVTDAIREQVAPTGRFEVTPPQKLLVGIETNPGPPLMPKEVICRPHLASPASRVTLPGEPEPNILSLMGWCITGCDGPCIGRKWCGCNTELHANGRRCVPAGLLPPTQEIYIPVARTIGDLSMYALFGLADGTHLADGTLLSSVDHPDVHMRSMVSDQACNTCSKLQRGACARCTDGNRLSCSTRVPLSPLLFSAQESYLTLQWATYCHSVLASGASGGWDLSRPCSSVGQPHSAVSAHIAAKDPLAYFAAQCGVITPAEVATAARVYRGSAEERTRLHAAMVAYDFDLPVALLSTPFLSVDPIEIRRRCLIADGCAGAGTSAHEFMLEDEMSVEA